MSFFSTSLDFSVYTKYYTLSNIIKGIVNIFYFTTTEFKSSFIEILTKNTQKGNL